MIEAIVTYLVVSKIINCFFIAVMVNAGAFELLFGAAVVLGILLMVASPNKLIGTVILGKYKFKCVKSKEILIMHTFLCAGKKET